MCMLFMYECMYDFYAEWLCTQHILKKSIHQKYILAYTLYLYKKYKVGENKNYTLKGLVCYEWAKIDGSIAYFKRGPFD